MDRWIIERKLKIGYWVREKIKLVINILRNILGITFPSGADSWEKDKKTFLRIMEAHHRQMFWSAGRSMGQSYLWGNNQAPKKDTELKGFSHVGAGVDEAGGLSVDDLEEAIALVDKNKTKVQETLGWLPKEMRIHHESQLKCPDCKESFGSCTCPTGVDREGITNIMGMRVMTSAGVPKNMVILVSDICHYCGRKIRNRAVQRCPKRKDDGFGFCVPKMAIGYGEEEN